MRGFGLVEIASSKFGLAKVHGFWEFGLGLFFRV